jgi:hypothetical protein
MNEVHASPPFARKHQKKAKMGHPQLWELKGAPPATHSDTL